MELFYHEISRNKREKCKSKKNFLNRNVGNAWLFTRNVDWTGWKKSHNYCIDWYQFRECLWQCGDVTEKDKRYESSRIRRCIRMEQTESKGWLFWWACVISASILANGEQIWIIALMPTETKLKIPNKWPILMELKYIFESNWILKAKLCIFVINISCTQNYRSVLNWFYLPGNLLICQPMIFTMDGKWGNDCDWWFPLSIFLWHAHWLWFMTFNAIWMWWCFRGNVCFFNQIHLW